MEISHRFLDKDFEGLILRPALFYSWKYGIRFEISHPWMSHYEKENLKQIFQRAITLFNKVFSEEDEILFVTDVHCTSSDLFLQRNPLNVYLKYITIFCSNKNASFFKDSIFIAEMSSLKKLITFVLLLFVISGLAACKSDRIESLEPPVYSEKAHRK